jgi:hypothetical protein
MFLLRWGEFCCASLPRAVPTADGVCPFMALVSALRGDCECA